MILLAEPAPSSLAAKKKRQVAPLIKASSTLKNRVWGFENIPSGRLGENPDLSWEIATGSVQFTYESVSGRGVFLQTDPLRFSAGDVNIYRYCGNNPLNLTDPTGQSWAGLGNVLTGAAAGAGAGFVTGAITGFVLSGFDPAGALAGGIAGAAVGAVAGGITGGYKGGSDNYDPVASGVGGLEAGALAGVVGGAGEVAGIAGGVGAGLLTGGVAGGIATDGSINGIATGALLGAGLGVFPGLAGIATEAELTTGTGALLIFDGAVLTEDGINTMEAVNHPCGH